MCHGGGVSGASGIVAGCDANLRIRLRQTHIRKPLRRVSNCVTEGAADVRLWPTPALRGLIFQTV